MDLRSKRLADRDRELDLAAGRLPDSRLLSQNYPNPFYLSATIAFQLRGTANVQVWIFDVLGREVALLADGVRSAGSHSGQFDGSGLKSGVYFCLFKPDQ